MTSNQTITTEHQMSHHEDPEQEHRQRPEPRDTPRHHDQMAILPGPCGPRGKIELPAARGAAPMAFGAVTWSLR